MSLGECEAVLRTSWGLGWGGTHGGLPWALLPSQPAQLPALALRGGSPAASVNLFCLSCTLDRTVARLCLGPAHPAALERVWGHKAAPVTAQGPWQGWGGVENALPVPEGAKLGRMDTPWWMMMVTVELSRPLSSGLDSAAAPKPWTHRTQVNSPGPLGPTEQRRNSGVLGPFPKLSCSSHQQHDLYQPVCVVSPLAWSLLAFAG